MSEQELKLHVPEASRAGVERELRQAGAERLPLHAMYFDTPDRELARARIAIRLRREGRNWVQTLKTPGSNAITRVEMNHARPGPILDLSVYAGTEVHEALADLKGPLGLRYETDVTRLVRKTRTRQGTVEIAYDVGVLRAGDLELPIREVEFELVSGRAAAIFGVARNWLARYGLVLDPRSKSERGDALARLSQTLAQPGLTEASRSAAIAQFWGPRPARPIRLTPEMTAPQGLAAVAAECLDQIARNAAMLAEVDTLDVYGAGQPEHVHQLRVGIRRLRSAWRLFRGWAQLPPADIQAEVRDYFSAFGANRDQDVLKESIIPALEKAGMPTFDMPDEEAPPVAARETASGAAFQGWLLRALEWSLDVGPADETARPPIDAASASIAASARPAAGHVVVPVRGHRDDGGEPLSIGTPEAALAGTSSMCETAAATGGDDASGKNGDSAAPANGNGQSGANGPRGAWAAHTTKASNGADGASRDASMAASGAIQPTIIPLQPPRAPRTVAMLLARRLRKWHAHVLREGRRFAELDIPSRHDLRKRAKRLRYGLSFAESLLPPHKTRDYRRRLAAVQDVLGEINDLAVAHDLYRQWSSRHPQAWFALGWISARQEKLIAEAEHAFAKLGQAKKFWK